MARKRRDCGKKTRHYKKAWALKNKAQQHELKTKIKAELGCKMCGIKDPDVLTFHHLRPEEKKFTIGHFRPQSLKRFSLEIRKCIILCHNCHMKQHKMNGDFNKQMRNELKANEVTQPELF